MEQVLDNHLSEIELLCSNSIKLGLNRIKEAIDKLDIKLNGFVVTVAGTNGKGSCISVMESYLLQDYKVATYTSPHLKNFKERIKINGDFVSDCLLFEAFDKIKKKVLPTIKVTWFEFVTLAAFYCFAQSDIDVYLLEIGLGGRLDCVNSIEPDISVITSVDLDHQDFLGDTREKIGFEKAGILRKNKIAVYGDKKKVDSILKVAKDLNSNLYQYGKDFSFKVNDSDILYFIKDKQYKLPKINLKPENIATAFMTLSKIHFLNLSEDKMLKAIKNCKLSARFEYKDNLILDVAHNPQASKYLAEKLLENNIYDVSAIFAIQKTKDWKKVINYLKFNISHWYLVDMRSDLFVPVNLIKEYLVSHNLVCSITSFDAMSEKIKDRQIKFLVFGSFYLVGKFV